MVAEESFGGWLRAYRKAHDLTRARLADQIGCSPELVYKIERGERRPSRQLAALLADVAQIDPGQRAVFIAFARGSQPPLPGVAGSPTPGEALAASAVRSAPLTGHPTNLHAPLTRLIGRETVLQELRAYLTGDAVHLLTLTGPPGVGKTRLGVQVGLDLLDHFRDGVFFVPLAAITSAPLLLDAIARALYLEDPGPQSLEQRLIDHLADKHMLLVLDNFEQVVPAAPAVQDLLEGCRGLKALVTSREALHVRGEQQYAVAPLALPDLAVLPPLAALAQYAAVTFFIDRARAVNSHFALTETNAAAVAAICVRADGLPLAIELLAARTKLLPPAALLARMAGPQGAEQLPLLTGGARDLPARHRTLHQAIRWSYDLLDVGERTLLARLGVFTGGCTLAAVEAVCDARGDLPGSAIAGIAALLDKSLVQHQPAPQDTCEPRFVLLEVIGEYARERLAESGEEATLRAWHAEYYLALAETADPQLSTAEQKLWFDRLECDYANLRAALAWVVTHGLAALAGRLSVALVHFWDTHSHLTEGRYWLERVLVECGSALPPALQAGVLKGAGSLALAQGDYPRARTLLTESLEVQRALGDDLGAAHSLSNLGLVAMDLGDIGTAEGLLEESLAIRRRHGETAGIAGTLSNLGLVLLYAGDTERATALLEESLAIRREQGDLWGCAAALTNLGEVARKQSDYRRAYVLYGEAIGLLQQVGAKSAILDSLGGLATIRAAQGQPQEAARLFGAEAALRVSIGIPLPLVDQEEYAAYIATVRGHLEEQVFVQAWAAGQALTLEEAVAVGLGREGSA